MPFAQQLQALRDTNHAGRAADAVMQYWLDHPTYIFRDNRQAIHNFLQGKIPSGVKVGGNQPKDETLEWFDLFLFRKNADDDAVGPKLGYKAYSHVFDDASGTMRDDGQIMRMLSNTYTQSDIGVRPLRHILENQMERVLDFLIAADAGSNFKVDKDTPKFLIPLAQPLSTLTSSLHLDSLKEFLFLQDLRVTFNCIDHLHAQSISEFAKFQRSPQSFDATQQEMLCNNFFMLIDGFNDVFTKLSAQRQMLSELNNEGALDALSKLHRSALVKTILEIKAAAGVINALLPGDGAYRLDKISPANQTQVGLYCRNLLADPLIQSVQDDTQLSYEQLIEANQRIRAVRLHLDRNTFVPANAPAKERDKLQLTNQFGNVEDAYRQQREAERLQRHAEAQRAAAEAQDIAAAQRAAASAPKPKVVPVYITGDDSSPPVVRFTKTPPPATPSPAPHSGEENMARVQSPGPRQPPAASTSVVSPSAVQSAAPKAAEISKPSGGFGQFVKDNWWKILLGAVVIAAIVSVCVFVPPIAALPVLGLAAHGMALFVGVLVAHSVPAMVAMAIGGAAYTLASGALAFLGAGLAYVGKSLFGKSPSESAPAASAPGLADSSPSLYSSGQSGMGLGPAPRPAVGSESDVKLEAPATTFSLFDPSTWWSEQPEVAAAPESERLVTVVGSAVPKSIAPTEAPETSERERLLSEAESQAPKGAPSSGPKSG
jgi:hypothetical protein